MTEYSAKKVVLKDANGVYLIPLGNDVRFDELNGYYVEATDGNKDLATALCDGNEDLTTSHDGNVGVYSLWDYLAVLTRRIVALEMNR